MGVGAANVIFLPIANRLKAISGEEVELRMMTVEGILSIQAGDNPRLVSEKLMSYVPPAERDGEDEAPARPASPSRPRRPRMAARARRRPPARRRSKHEESNERWLLTYADMITLLMALFMVLFSISSVNISKYQTLQQSLKAAFSGQHPARAARRSRSRARARTRATRRRASTCRRSCRSPRTTASTPAEQHHARRGAAPRRTAQRSRPRQHAGAAVRADQARARRVRARRTASARTSRRRSNRAGLVIRVLTDDLLFASGQATLEPALGPRCWARSPSCSTSPTTHPIDVEGNTDNVPIHCARYPSNWELSTARASTVVRFLVRTRASAPSRLTATGYADQHPIASDATAAGRARNRRVEIVAATDRYRPKRTLGDRTTRTRCSRTRR